MKRYDLLIFDWDGTLADSEALIVGTMQGAIRALDLPPRKNAQIAELIGLGLNEGLEILFPDHSLDELQALLKGYRETWLANVAVQEAPLFDGVLAAVSSLQAGGGRIAIATGKSRVGLDRALAAAPALGPLVECSRCADETASKPDPTMLHELLVETGVPASRALMIGDTSYDIEMALAAGIDGLGVNCGVHGAERIRAAGALDLIDDVAALPGWLRTGARGRR